VAERIRRETEAKAFTFEGKRLPVTLSAGVSVTVDRRISIDDLLKRADEAVYKSKDGGRNRVTLSDG
jgi:diguanylate cyclase (GGDEF)-like protein